MSRLNDVLLISVSLAILFSVAYSDIKRCKCLKEQWLFCRLCTSGCRKSGSNCVPCPEHCVNCKNSTHCSTCAPGHWGKICEKECYSDHCKGNTCSKDTGLCTNGCVEGYFGLKSCNKCPRSCLTCYSQNTCDKCLQGFSGRDCRFRCDNCIDDQCDKSGCTKGCESGYFPSTSFRSRFNVPPCLKCPDSCITCTSFGECFTCTMGFYGRGCQYKCDECKNRHCNKTGCLEGCGDGFYRESDKTDFYCRKCPKYCATCISKSRCESCPKGFYGVECQSRCNLNCLNDVCNMTNGVCLHGCKIGFYQENNDCVLCPSCNKNGSCHGDNCQTSCCQVMASPPTCSEGCKGAKCKEVDGHCVEGCKDGWTGQRCEVKCSNDTCLIGGAKKSVDQSQDPTIILGSVIGGGAFVMTVVIMVVVMVTVRRSRSRYPSTSKTVSSGDQEVNEQTSPPVTSYENNVSISASLASEKPSTNTEMTSPAYEEISCFEEGSQQYEELSARDEHIYMHGVAEEQDYVN